MEGEDVSRAVHQHHHPERCKPPPQGAVQRPHGGQHQERQEVEGREGAGSDNTGRRQQ